MGLAEGTPRKDGQPAKKTGYPAGNPPPGAGRPRRKTCALSECELPPGVGRTSSKRPYGQFCSESHEYEYGRRQSLRRYGITYEDYDRRFEEQGGVCAVCGSDDPLSAGRPRKDGKSFPPSFHVDHDHETMEFRGLLCSNCNRMLGQARDSSEILELGAVYLKRFGR